MTHVFIAKRLFGAGHLLEKRWHIDPFTQREIDGKYFVELLGNEFWHGDVAYPLYLAVVIALSYLAYRWIEQPGREWARNRVRMRPLQMRPLPAHGK